jgi:alkyl hydroperoxide reductase subunit AhpC
MSSSQPAASGHPLLPGDTAPNFKVSSYQAGGQLKAAELAKFKGSGPIVLLFYPADFDLILASELAQLRAQLPAGTVVMAASTDYVEVHQVWADQEVREGGLLGYDVILLR